MSDQFVAEIRIFAFDFAPTGWAFCDGQILPISQNTALFSLMGTMYGGNGQSTFALPNLQGAIPIHPGQGPGLSHYDQGQRGGSDAVTLLESEIPAHTHRVQVSLADANHQSPEGSLLATGVGVGPYGTVTSPVTLAPEATSVTGGSQPHNNLMPYRTVNFCIALWGVFPPRQ